MRFTGLCSLLVLLSAATTARGAEPWRLSGKTCEIAFRASDAAIQYFGPKGRNDSIFHSGPAGLWEAKLQDGRLLRAAELPKPDGRRQGEGSLRFDFHGDAINVTVTATAAGDAFDLTAEVSPRQGVLLSFALPARLEFAPERLVRLVAPASGNESVGFGLRGGFFQKRADKKPYYQYRATYPPAFADFFHWETAAGQAAVYRVQPRTWQPWHGAKDPLAIFTPGEISFGGSPTGGFCDRPFTTYVPAGQSWRSPPVRLAFGQSAADSLRSYAEANRISRRLEEKMPGPVLDRFKQSVLVYYGGDCASKLAHLEQLPRPAMVHFADYLRGGFDKEYPDHLPPPAGFGTPDEFRRFCETARRLGHLVMPYTNPTWWCDGPRGPTFLEHGEAPLLRLLDGRLSHERYAKNEGFTVCHWHPAVQAANRKTVEQFTREYPVDVLFQDQCGARGWRYDTNPACPRPDAYTEGLVSMVAEDAGRVPLSTESGWDGVVNFESQLCGMSWAIVPTEGGPTWRRLMRERYDPATWDVFPVAQYIAHDRAAMVHHDLGQFVTNRQVLAWTLGLGFGLSARIAPAGLDRPAQRQWLLWLDRLQKSVCAGYIGRPLDEFCHERRGGDGIMHARYGDLRVTANLDATPRTKEGRELAGFGFLATAPGLVAANLQRLAGLDFGREGLSLVSRAQGGATDVWLYAPAEQEVAILLPQAVSGKATARFDDGRTAALDLRDGTARVRLPALAGRTRIDPPNELARPPRQWPGGPPAIGVLDFGPALAPVWTRIKPADWLAALRASRPAREWGVAVKTIADSPQLDAALAAGPTGCLAIVNPYGERFPAIGGDWQATLDRVRAYVNRGGCWWEAAGHSFHSAVTVENGVWRTEPVGPRGFGHFGLPIGGGEVDQAPEPLTVTPDGRRWLGEATANRLAAAQAIVNRGLPRSSEDPGHVTLVAGQKDYIGGYRLDGWGWLWRVGGFWPDAEVALPVAVGVLEHLYTHAPEPPLPGGTGHLWHLTLRLP